jgi:hypothetical protein
LISEKIATRRKAKYRKKTGAGHDNEQKKEDRHGHREERNESMKSKKTETFSI